MSEQIAQSRRAFLTRGLKVLAVAVPVAAVVIGSAKPAEARRFFRRRSSGSSGCSTCK